MADREQVIQRLSHLERYGAFSEDWKKAFRDAIALLREQEPVRFKVTQQRRSYPFWDAECSGCGYKTSTIHTNWKYCPECGRAVKWDG